MEYLKLCESDYRFMNLIWDNEPVLSGKLVELCRDILGWKKSTTYTMLKKLCEKGYATNQDAIVSSLISREAVQSGTSNYVVEETFNGSLPSFIAAFLGGKTISEQEAAELKSLIDNYQRR